MDCDRLYLDIETYRSSNGAFIDEKIIAIGIIEETISQNASSQGLPSHFFLEWNSGSEEKVVHNFYHYLQDKIKGNKCIEVVGFNILRFDIPLLTQKGAKYRIDELEKLNSLWHNTFAIDFAQIFLPYNGLRFKNLSLSNLVKFAKEKGIEITEPHRRGVEVKQLYEEKKYDEIEKHLKADLQAIFTISHNYDKLLKEFNMI